MKKYIVIVLALASVFAACSRDEESLFDQSAAERSQAALDNANAILPSPANGWEMLYFANPESRGYSVLVTFDENGRVIATAKNKAATNNKMLTDSASTWQVKLDYGPILTFDTYNEILHAWSDPRNDGDGLLGDYEFLILHADSLYIKLKGKKHSGYCYLYPYNGKEQAEYFTSVEATYKRLLGNGNVLHVYSNNEEYLLYEGSSGLEGIFLLTLPGEVPNLEEPDIYPFATLEDGFQFMISPRALGDTKFEIREGKLVGENSIIKPQAVPAYFNEYMLLRNGTWVIDIKDVNDSIKNAIAVVDAALKAKYTGNKKKASVQGLRYKYYENKVIVVLSYIGKSSKANDIYFDFDCALENNAINVAYVGPTNEAAENVLTAFPEIEDLLKTLNGSFTMTTGDPLNPTFLSHLKENSNPDLWFDMTGKLE